jgi:hypothetical protein
MTDDRGNAGRPRLRHETHQGTEWRRRHQATPGIQEPAAADSAGGAK